MLTKEKRLKLERKKIKADKKSINVTLIDLVILYFTDRWY